ncbi:MAG: ABC transporter permease [Lachnospiraceae bacterium]|nr:ABC transporter permease [Lachnospiraceae bacterium]
MNRVLRKRMPREIKNNFFRYLALFLMIVLCMYIVTSMVGAAEIVIQGTENNQKVSKLEDGQVTVFSKFTDKELKAISDKGVTIEPHFSFEVTLKDNSVLRVFKNREKVDLVTLDQGTLAKKDNEIVLEKRYCEEHDINLGDTINLAGKTFTVTGIGSSVDYDAPLRKFSDTAIDSLAFGTAFVTEDGYNKLKSGDCIGTEDLTYGFLLGDAMTSDELKEMIKDFDFDYKAVDDPYYQEILADTYGKKDEISDGINDLVDGTDDLVDGVKELYDGTKEFKEGLEPYRPMLPEAYEGAKELHEGAEELRDGTEELKDGVDELKEKSDEMLDKIFDESPNNITSYILREDNMRIGGAAGDIEINKTSGLLEGIIIIILFAYVLSVFVIHQIQNESSVIGALYAMGVRKKDLMRHYIFLPTIISFLGGLAGAIIGLSGFGSSLQTSDFYSYYSLPEFGAVIPAYLIIYAVIMPPVVSLIVNILVINKSLSRTALSLIRNEQKVSKSKDIRIKNMKFVPMFRIRQILRERRTAVTVMAGMIICLMIFMMGFNCYTLCDSVGRLSVEDTKYEYLYTYKYPTKDVPEGGEACYVETLKKEMYGYTLDVSVMGIDGDNPFINAKPVKGKNKIVASDAVTTRYNLNVGDMIILSDTANDMNYAFAIEEIVPYSVGLTVFMDIDSMRELFGKDDDYYNVVMSDHKLDIEEGRLYSTSTKADAERSSHIFVDLMKPLFLMLISCSAVVFFIVMYLMTSVMIDRGSFGISLFKIFGFKSGEIKKLYLDGNRITVAVGSLIAIPLAKLIIDKLFPVFIPNVACCVHLEYNWYMYIVIFAVIMLIYQIISIAITGKLNKITPAEVLKNRE